jgi:uncharacterized protein with NRDE domain
MAAMCVLALFLDPGGPIPLIAAANRDEALSRPSRPPGEVEPGIVAGRDLAGGGTWLGVNDRGLFVAVTNRRAPEKTDASYSRGLLALEALRCRRLG